MKQTLESAGTVANVFERVTNKFPLELDNVAKSICSLFDKC